MVWGSVRSGCNQICLCPQLTSHRMNLGCFQRFLQRKRWQYGWQTLRQHGFTGSGRTNHDDVMPTSSRNFERPFDILLPLYMRKIYVISIYLSHKQIACVAYQWGNVFFAVKKFNGFLHGRYPNDIQIIDDGGFLSVFDGQNEAFITPFSGFDCDGQYAFNGPQ